MAINIKVARVPGKVTEVVLEDGGSVKQALEAAGITNYANCTFTVDEAEKTLDSKLADGDTLLVANRTVKGAVIEIKVSIR